MGVPTGPSPETTVPTSSCPETTVPTSSCPTTDHSQSLLCPRLCQLRWSEPLPQPCRLLPRPAVLLPVSPPAVSGSCLYFRRPTTKPRLPVPAEDPGPAAASSACLRHPDLPAASSCSCTTDIQTASPGQ